MLLYQGRRFQVYLFRIAGLTLLFACVYLFSVNKSDYAIVTAFLFLMAGIIPVTSLRVYDDSFVLSRYLFYGFLPKRIEVDSSCQVKLTPVEVEITQPYSAPDTFWDLLFSFVPSQNIKTKKFRVTKIDFYGNTEKVILKLSSEELQLLRTRVTNQQLA